MTTIAFDGEILAADRQTSEGGSMFRLHSKLVEIPGGWAAGCGSVPQIKRFMAWAKKGMKGKPPADLDECGAIVIRRGKVHLWEDGVPIDMDPGERVATGSGWKWAAAAMDFGHSAIEAIEYASTRDCYTGGGVDSCRPLLKPTKKSGKR